MDPGEYTRAVETYLCRKNDGHLIRIVGPAFEQVCGWAGRGIPLKLVYRGIDRFFERYYAKGPRRRPVRIEFCEADVLDLYDQWRLAVGVAGAAFDGEEAQRSRPRRGLQAHIDGAVARLTMLRAGPETAGALADVLDRAARELDAVRAAAGTVRGQARTHLLDRLGALDRELLEAARQAVDASTLDGLRREAEAELEPFRARMPTDTFVRSVEACLDGLLRERLHLPHVAFD